LFISHDLPVIRQMCDRVAVMSKGNICEINTTENIFNKPKHSYTKELISLIPKIEFVKSNKIDLILTYNIGCSLNFINSININNMKRVDVMHPISFINERLK